MHFYLCGGTVMPCIHLLALYPLNQYTTVKYDTTIITAIVTSDVAVSIPAERLSNCYHPVAMTPATRNANYLFFTQAESQKVFSTKDLRLILDIQARSAFVLAWLLQISYEKLLQNLLLYLLTFSCIFYHYYKCESM